MHRSATPHAIDVARDRLGPALLCRPVGQQAFWAREIDGRGAGIVGHLESPNSENTKVAAADASNSESTEAAARLLLAEATVLSLDQQAPNAG